MWRSIIKHAPRGYQTGNRAHKITDDTREENKGLNSTHTNHEAFQISLAVFLLSFPSLSLLFIMDVDDCHKWSWWRSAFLGMLKGFETWKKTLENNNLRLNTSTFQSKSLFLYMELVIGSKVETLTHLVPFRPSFCVLELETEGLLKQIGKGFQVTTVEHSNIYKNLAPIENRKSKDVQCRKALYVTLSQMSAFVADKIEFFNHNTNTGPADIGDQIFKLGNKWDKHDSARAKLFYDIAIFQFPVWKRIGI